MPPQGASAWVVDNQLNQQQQAKLVFFVLVWDFRPLRWGPGVWLTPQGTFAWVVDNQQPTNITTSKKNSLFCGFSLGFSAPTMECRGVLLVWDYRPLRWGPGVWCWFGILDPYDGVQGCGLSLGFRTPTMRSKLVVLILDFRPLRWGPEVWF